MENAVARKQVEILMVEILFPKKRTILNIINVV